MMATSIQLIQLPIDEQLSEAMRLLTQNQNLVVSASPGAGKTTRLPPALLELTDKEVWVLEPRRMSAVAAATRIAEEQRWELGREVGYQVRFESKTSKNTRLVFLTEALLARKILQDPELKNVGIIVLDEFHERSIHVDLALGLLKELQMMSRPDLKIVVMSATLDVEAVSKFLDGAPILDVPGRLFDLQVSKSKQSQLLRTDFQFIKRVEEAITKNPNERDVLVFLPGLSEISRVEKALENWAREKDIFVFILSGSLSIQEQLKVLKPALKRKVILSTNVAESSVTIDGVDMVIDSGLARVLRKHPKTDFEQLTISRISKASAKQRAGRAARQWPGRCIQLWTSQDELSMPDFEVAEILRTDLTETVLFLKKWGIRDLNQFSWFESPQTDQLMKCESWLEKIGALKNGEITKHGLALAEIPVHPRLGQILNVSESLGAGELGCDIAAILQEREIRTLGHHHAESDLIERIEMLEGRSRSPVIDTILKSSDQLKRWVKHLDQKVEVSFELIAEIMLLASPDRLCRRRQAEQRRAVMVGGRGVELEESSSVKRSEFFIALNLMESDTTRDTQVRMATGVPKNLIEKHFANQFEKNAQLTFDEESKNFYIEEFKSLWGLPLEEPRRRLAKPDEVEEQLPQAIFQKWSYVCEQNQDLKDWWLRFQYYEKQSKSEQRFWTEEKILEALRLATMGENKWLNVIQKDLVYFFESLLAPSTRADFKNKCPSQIEVPTKNKIRLHYHLDKGPHLEVRLQELFGMKQTPRIWDDDIAVILHLLGPNYRPVQITSDLASFWENTYPKVKSELRIKYPKHSWPENPLNAVAVAKGRSRS